MKDAGLMANETLDSLVRGEFEQITARFRGMMRTAVSAATLRSGVETVFRDTGSITKRHEPEIRQMGSQTGVSITCECENGVFDFQVAFEGDAIVGMLLRPKQDLVEHPPPRYAPGGSFEEQNVVVGSDDGGLPGTLTLPRKRKKKKPLSTVVLVHGSGPNDRDETVGGSKVFLDLAWGLAARGIASLRYEKRTKARPDTIGADVTVEEEVITDALAAVSVARERSDAADVYVLGHSLGGTLAPALGARDPAIGGLIVLAGMTRQIGETILDQMRHLSEGEDPSALTELEEMCARADDPKLHERTAASKLPLGMTAKYILSLRAHAPDVTIADVRRRMLILHAERDYQVTQADLEGWKRLTAGRGDVTIKTYPELNHLFAKGSGKSMPAEYQLPANVDERVIKDIAAWIG